MKTRETIHYTVELRLNGNFNIYEGSTCTARTLKWSDVSPAGTAEILGAWVTTWADNAKREKRAEENLIKFKELFLNKAREYAEDHDCFDVQEALSNVLEDAAIRDTLNYANPRKIADIVEDAAEHYIW